MHHSSPQRLVGVDIADPANGWRASLACFGDWRAAARSNSIREQEITMMAESIQPRLEAVLAVATVGTDT
ncbi:hypothetical protein [Demetria terragena]|uniref:hypothetical protein n=1 Tax=Demetria terragena TaxID=63959 RepID=UPI000362D47A|nr:hypothetical protein [Demetria terragena]